MQRKVNYGIPIHTHQIGQIKSFDIENVREYVKHLDFPSTAAVSVNQYNQTGEQFVSIQESWDPDNPCPNYVS